MIIGICGLIGSGKGTVADYLVKHHNFVKISFADKLKDSVATLFDWPRNLLEGDTVESRNWREKPDQYWSNELNKPISPRYVLQVFGTECMREGFFDEIWVSMVKKKILEQPDVNWVIPDTRFPNEVEMIKSIKGQVFRIVRGPDPKWFSDFYELGIQPTDVHASEWAWAHEKFDQIIDNNKDLNHLQLQLDQKLSIGR